jgi:uncharacterized protein
MKVLADTGFFVALFNPKDHHHTLCKAFLASHPGSYVSTWAVFTEVCFVLPPARHKHFFAWTAEAEKAGQLEVASAPGDAIEAHWQLMNKYDDLPMDFCDASLVLLAVERKIEHIATVDARDFSVYRLPGNRKFKFVLGA